MIMKAANHVQNKLLRNCLSRLLLLFLSESNSNFNPILIFHCIAYVSRQRQCPVSLIFVLIKHRYVRPFIWFILLVNIWNIFGVTRLCDVSYLCLSTVDMSSHLTCFFGKYLVHFHMLQDSLVPLFMEINHCQKLDWDVAIP